MDERSYQLDAYCGQCKGPKGNLVVIGNWRVILLSRQMWMEEHGNHVPMEIKASKAGDD